VIFKAVESCSEVTEINGTAGSNVVPSIEVGVNVDLLVVGRGELVDPSRLFVTLYSHGVSCFTQFAQLGCISSHCPN
jgi:hypothetical protein